MRSSQNNPSTHTSVKLASHGWKYFIRRMAVKRSATASGTLAVELLPEGLVGEVSHHELHASLPQLVGFVG